MGYLILLAIAIVGFFIWMSGTVDVQRERECKLAYGQEYTLHHQPANSAIQSCEGPNGEMKVLP